MPYPSFPSRASGRERSTYRRLVRLLAPATALSLLLLPTPSTAAASTPTAMVRGSYSYAFPGNPPAPQAWNPTTWNVVVHSRDRDTWDELEPMAAQHGSDCGPPPATHTVSRYEDAVFLCRGHVMTAIEAGGYGVIYLTPSQLLNFPSGEAVLSFRVSTARTSQRDWMDLWITPFNDVLELPALDWLPDLQGPPRNAIHISMANFSQGTGFIGEIYQNFQIVDDVSTDTYTTYESFLTPSATTRTLLELHLSRNYIKFGMPEYDQWWIDTSIDKLGWSAGVVQLGHHSYHPTKCDPSDTCGPNTWHWGDFYISSALPFTLVRADTRVVNDWTSAQVNFPAAAPKNAHLQFAGIGDSIDLSFDGGRTWHPAETQAEAMSRDGFESYWTPIPAGVKSIQLRGENWWGGPWWVRDISIWAPPA